MNIKINQEKCLGCSVCTKHCEAGALTVVAGKANVDESKCTKCYACLGKCIFGALRRVH